jgi:hypothetical protein
MVRIVKSKDVATAEVHRFWIPSQTSTGVSRHRDFVLKSDFNKLAKAYRELKIRFYDMKNG